MRMSVQSLEEEIQHAIRNGIIPVMVVATAGTPTLGAIDPIEEIVEITTKYNLWLHVDASKAGACLLSEKQKHRLKGIDG